jgi:uncharacterized membrane protein YfcA
MEIPSLSIIFLLSLGASAFGTLVGGTSLITIPALILLGLPPHTAIGTDRFGIIGIGLAGLYEFHRKKMIDYRLSCFLAVPTFLGAIFGANLVFSVPETVLGIIIVLTNVLGLIYLLLNPRLGLVEGGHALGRHRYGLGGLLCFIIGVYGGFYGAMTASFLAYVLIIWFGQTFIQSAANIKVASVCFTISAASVFFLKGAIDYPLGVAIFSGCLCGSYLGAHFSDRIGNLRIKRVFLTVLTLMILKMALNL